MKTTKITLNILLQIFCFVCFSLLLVPQNTLAQTTVTYTQQTANYYSNFTSGATFGNQGSYQVGMTARTAAPKQVVAWRKFRTDASGTNSSDRSMQIGDQFVVTLSATRAYGQIGFALLASPSTGSFANRESNYAVSVYLPGALYNSGSWTNYWTVKSSGGTTTAATFGGNQNPTWKNFTFTLTLVAANRMNITITDGTNTSNFYDVQLNTSNPITDYSIYQEDDWDGGGNMGCYWGLGAVGTQHKLTDNQLIAIGSSNNSYSISAVLSNGLAANSASTVSNNSLTKSGTGNITLSATNTYSGTTTISGGTLTLGKANAIPSGAAGIQSAVTLNGGTLSTGSASTGFSSGTSSNPMGVLTVGSSSGTIALASGSSSQNLYFANSSAANWTGNLNITGWSGTVGSTGTNGHIYVGSSASGLTTAQLARISFAGYSGSFATILSTGEIVPAAVSNPSPLFFSSGNFASPNSWTEKNAAYMSAMTGKAPTNNTTYSISTNSNNTGSDYFKFFSDVTGSGYYYGPATNSSQSLSTAFTMSTANRTAGQSYYIAGTSGNLYVFKTFGTSSSDAKAVVFDLGASGVVRTVSSVTQSPLSANVYEGYPTTVTATISGAFTGTQIPYLRYSTSATFATSTVVAMTGSGTTYTASIPAQINVASTPVYYYVFTSGSGGTNPATDGSDADLFAINYNDNSGSNYSYTPLQGIPAITFSASSPGSGTSGYVGNTVTITGSNLSGVNSIKIGGDNGVSVPSFNIVNSTTITFIAVDATGTIWVSDGNTSSTSAATYTNLGYYSNANADWNTGSTWLGGSVPTAGSAVTIANAVTLNAAATNNPVSVTINSGKSLTIGTSGSLIINAGGSLTNNGNASLGNAGSVTFAGAATVTGATTFNNLILNGSTNFANAPSINGTLTLNTGASLLTNSPVYGSSATINYNLNNGWQAKYNQSLEWSATSGPANILLSSNSWVQLTSNRSLTGDLTVTGGALQATGALRTLTMSGTTQSINIAGGAIYGTDNGVNNDLQLTVASGSTTTITGNATSSSDDEKKFFNINVNSGGTLVLSRGILCKHGTFIVSGNLQINQNGYVQSNNTTNGALATTNAGADFSLGGSLIYNTGGSFNVTDKEWPVSNYPVNVTIQNSGTSVILNNSKIIAGDLTVATGSTLDFGTYTANRGTAGGTLSVAGTLKLGGTSGGQTGSNFPSNFSTTSLTGSVNYSSTTGGQTIYDVPAYSTLVISNTSGSQSLANNFFVPTLDINAGATLSLAAGKQLTISNSLINNGVFNVNSGSTVLTPTSVSGNGTTNVSQNLADQRNWYMSSPVNGASVPSGYTVFQYDEPGNNTDFSVVSSTAYWHGIATGSTYSPGRGYIVLPGSVPATLTFSGTLNTSSSITIPLTYQGAVKTGFNLIGNPFPAHYTVSKSQTDAANALNTIWYRTATWNSQTGKYVYTFQTCLINQDGNTMGTPESTTNIVPPLQAFWVRTNVDNSSFIFEGIRSHQNSNALKVPAKTNLTESLLRLQVSDGIISDEAVLYTNSAASNNFDSFDALKMNNNNASVPEIYTLVDDQQIAINGMNSIPTDVEIPIGFTTGTAGNFTIKASQILNFDPSVSVYLKDYNDLTNTPIQLGNEAIYTFSSEQTSNNTSRFALIFRSASVATGVQSGMSGNVWINSTGNGQIVINRESSTEATISIYNAIGQRLYNNSISTNKLALSTNLTPGVYTVIVSNSGNTSTLKLLVR